MQKKTLDIIGLKAVGFVDDNIESKRDDKGKPYEPYSFGYWLQKKYKKKSRAKSRKAKTKFLEAALSAYEGAKNNVTLSDTSDMRSALGVVKTDSGTNTATIGYETAEAAQKAFYHNITGAGKGRKRRRFMFLTEAQKKSLAEYARDELVKDTDFAKELVRMLGV